MKEDNFFDRENYLAALEKRVLGLKDGYRQNIAILGDELIGKTSLIFKFMNRFYDNRIILVYLDVRPESLTSFAYRFIAVLLYNFLKNIGIPLKEELDFLIRKSSSYIPETVGRIRYILKGLDKRQRNHIFSDLLSLCEIIHRETGKSCVLIFDEFHNLEHSGVKNIYAEWSKILLVQKNTMHIITSSARHRAQAVLSKNLSLLFGNFEVLNIEPFDVKTSEEYLRQFFKDINLSAALRNFLVHFTGGHPFYLEVISKATLKADIPNLVDALVDLLFASSGILHMRFQGYVRRFSDSAAYGQECISVLHLISQGNNRIKEIAHILHKTQRELVQVINHLSELDAINRSGDFLKINDRVFGFWLRFVYQERMHSLNFDSKNEEALFRKNIENMLQEFVLSSNKPVSERVMELLRLFDDDTVQLEKKRLRLSRFREIKPLEFRNRIKNGIICRSTESLWIVGFKEDPLTDEDISGFAKECRKYRHKLQRKIIVALRGSDPNARLRAMEEKVWMWDLNNLNQILDLFSRPRLIIC